MPLRVLVIARWYPAVDDPVRGSFVADQVAALAATGRVAPVVASFEFVRLNRLAERQEPERRAIHERFGPALARRDALVAGGWPALAGTWPAIGRVPVARLPVAAGPDDPPVREADDHLAAFLPFLEAETARRAAAAAPFDLVHAHTGFPDGVLAAVAARRLGVPYVVTEHSSRTTEILADPLVRRRYVEALTGAARVIVVSAALAADLRGALPELATVLDERLAVIPNAVPVELFRAPPIRERTRGQLLYVGTRKPDKGIATLLEAFALARAERADLSLRLVGRSTTEADEAAWRALAAELGVADAVAFEPPTDRAGVADAMARADVFVHPSRRETFGMVAVEALAAGLPVVATASGGVEEILGPDPSAAGAVVPVDDAPALARAVLDVLARRETFEPARLRARAEERFASANVAARLLEAYETATQELNARRGAATVAAHAVTRPAEPPAAAAPSRPRLVVAFNRVRAARLLGPLPAALRAELTVVTADGPADQRLPDGLGRVVEVDLDAGYRAALDAARPAPQQRGLVGRALRFARDPGASDRIAAIHARRTEHRLETARQAVRDEAAAAARSRTADEARSGTAASPVASPLPAAPADLVCLDGYDVQAAGLALDEGVASLAPGSARWLADRWAADRARTDGAAPSA